MRNFVLSTKGALNVLEVFKPVSDMVHTHTHTYISDVYFLKVTLGYCIKHELWEVAKSGSRETTAAWGSWQKISKEIKVPRIRVIATK